MEDMNGLRRIGVTNRHGRVIYIWVPEDEAVRIEQTGVVDFLMAALQAEE